MKKKDNFNDDLTKEVIEKQDNFNDDLTKEVIEKQDTFNDDLLENMLEDCEIENLSECEVFNDGNENI